MAKRITSQQQLLEVFHQEMAQVLEYVSKEITDKLMNTINSRIYSRGHSSEYYTRTYQFFDSIIMPQVEVKRDSVSVKIGMDYTKMKPMIAENNGMFNQHMGFPSQDSWRGITVSEALLSWWDYGTDSSIHSLPQTNYWKDVFGDRAYEENPNYVKLDKLIEEIMIREFGKFGNIRIKRK